MNLEIVLLLKTSETTICIVYNVPITDEYIVILYSGAGYVFRNIDSNVLYYVLILLISSNSNNRVIRSINETQEAAQRKENKSNDVMIMNYSVEDGIMC